MHHMFGQIHLDPIRLKFLYQKNSKVKLVLLYQVCYENSHFRKVGHVWLKKVSYKIFHLGNGMI